MIKCKEDLYGTRITNDHGELRDLYLGLCDKFGLLWLSGSSALTSTTGMQSRTISVLECGTITADTLGIELTFDDLLAPQQGETQTNNLETQTQEEKEALDKIKPVHLRDYQKGVEQTEHQKNMRAFKSNPVIKLSIDELDKFDNELDSAEWNGEGLPPVGVECEVYCPVNPVLPDGDKEWMKTEIIAIINCGFGAETTVVYRSAWSAQWYVDANPSGALKFRKPESPEEKENRERLEAAYDLYLLRCNAVNYPITYEFNEFKLQPDAADGWLAVVDKTNYRKEQ